MLGVLDLSDDVHVLLKLIPGVWICVLKPLNCHRRTVIKHCLVNRPQAAFFEHLRRCSEQFLQLELIPPIEEHKPASVCATSPIAICSTITITLLKGLYILMCLKRVKEQFYTCAFPPGAPSTMCFFLDQKYTCGYVLGALSTMAVSQLTVNG